MNYKPRIIPACRIAAGKQSKDVPNMVFQSENLKVNELTNVSGSSVGRAIYLLSGCQGFKPRPILIFQACMLVLLQESCTDSWLNAKKIPIHQINSVVTLHTHCLHPVGNKVLKP